VSDYNDYDPIGGHSREEAEDAYAELFYALHGGRTEAPTGKAREQVFVIGHKAPDTDSICAAIAYARLKAQLDPARDYIPCRAGRYGDEAAFVLSYFDVPAPLLLEDLKTRIRDINIRTWPGVPPDTSLREAWDLLKDRGTVTLPVTDKVNSGKAGREGPLGDKQKDAEPLLGLVTVKDIGKVYLDNNDPALLTHAETPVRNLLRVLGGRLVCGDVRTCLRRGEIMIAAAGKELLAGYIEPGDIVLVADREDIQLFALEQGASCLVITVGATASGTVRALAREKDALLIETGFDTFQAARLMNQSIPVRFAMATKDIVSFSPDDPLADVVKAIGRSRHRDFPVLDRQGNFKGMISRRFLLDAPPRRAILVDHNEKTQAVAGIDEAYIEEIIDHHRIAPIETIHPITFRNQPYGSTCTILYELYAENGIEPDRQTAGLLCAAILSDTLMFRSPTTTRADRACCAALANLAGLDIEDFATRMFSAGAAAVSSAKDMGDPEALLLRDFKIFPYETGKIGVSQINFMDRESLSSVCAALRPALESVRKRKEVTRLFVLLTNIPESFSDVLFSGDGAETLLETAFEKQAENGLLHLNDVVSRKLQFVPELLQTLQEV